VIALSIIESVDPAAPASPRQIRRIAVHYLVSRETLGGEKVNCITFDIAGE
jgi:hypothetical protein